MSLTQPLVWRRRLAVHGLAVEICNAIPGIEAAMGHFLSDFLTTAWPEGFTPLTGVIRRFDSMEVMKHVSPAATPVPNVRDLVELYQDRERFWLVDDRWGLCEIDMLKGRWTSWIVANPLIDPLRAMELSVLWPMAQLLRMRGLQLMPAISVTRDGFGVMILSNGSIEPELIAMLRSGYRIIGQRWTALRVDGPRVEMLQVPGLIERQFSPHLKLARDPDPTQAGRNRAFDPMSQWTDLTREVPGSKQNHAFCDVVLITEPGRRVHPHLRELNHFAAINVLRKCWPIVDLHPNRRPGAMPSKLAAAARVGELQLSKDPHDLLVLLDSIRNSPRPQALNTGVPALSLHLENIRKPVISALAG